MSRLNRAEAVYRKDNSLFSTVLIAVFFVTAISVFISRPKFRDRGETHSLTWVGVIPLVLALIILAVSTMTTVQAKQVGVLTTFGKTAERTLDSGLHFKAPWQKVTEIDATTQTNEYHGDEAIKVILSDKNTADISATIRWAVSREDANDVYAEFRSDDPTDSLRKAVVSTQFKAALNSVFNSYDAASNESTTPEELAAQVEEILAEKTDGFVDVKSVTISYIKPDEAVQRKIDALQTQRGATLVANEKKTTAKAEAEANKILSNSISDDPNVLVSKCLDLISEGAFTPPAGFSCWPGGSGGVVIPSAK